MAAKKGTMAKQTVLVNRAAWLEEVKRIASENNLTITELNARVAPEKSSGYITTIKTDNPRIDFEVVKNLKKYGADLNEIIATDEKPEPEETSDTKRLGSIEKRLETLNDQMGTAIELLSTMINIWRGTDHDND